MIKITAEMLRDRNCHVDSIETFNELFPDGLEINSEQDAVETAVKVSSEFGWDLAPHYFLNAAGCKEYEKAETLAREEYQKADASAWEEYERAIDRAWAEYQKAKDVAWAEHKKAVAPARAERESTRAAAFARLFWKQEVGE